MPTTGAVAVEDISLRTIRGGKDGSAPPPPNGSNINMDEFLCLGRYTIVLCILSELIILSQLSNMFFMMYAGVAPTIVGCGAHRFGANESVKARCEYLAVNGVKSAHSLVDLFNGDEVVEGEGEREGTGKTRCAPIFSSQFGSVNREFGYFCEGTKLVKQSISVQMLGVVAGSVVFGYLSDSYGRRKVMLAALSLCTMLMFASSFATSLLSFTMWRFLVSIFNGGQMVIIMVYNVENIPKKDRFWINSLINWSPNIVIFAVVAYLSGEWRTLSRVAALLSTPALVLLM